MIYSTQICPYCKTVLRSDKNPNLEIGNPFFKCRNCHKIIVNQYVQEWITIKPLKRMKMKTLRLFNKKELFDDIDLSLRRTKVIEYVEQLKKAGFEIYPIENYEAGVIHDDAVNYSLTNYNYPKDVGIRIKKQELPQVIEFTSNGYDSTIKFLKMVEMSAVETLSHNDRVYYAYRSFKISLTEVLFPNGIKYADFIICEFAKIMKVDLEKCHCEDYFYILVIYYEIMCEMILEHNKTEIANNIMKKFPNILTQGEVVYALISILEKDFVF